MPGLTDPCLGTAAHGAAVLPFRRWGFVTSALLVGSFAPDFEYFLRLAPGGKFGHTLAGTFVLTLPLALLTLWLFHRFIKLPLVGLLPGGVQRRLSGHVPEFRFGGTPRFALIVSSILLGIATHLAWDSFTHPRGWFYDHWPTLQRWFQVPLLGPTPLYKLLQHISTMLGLCILVFWLILLYRDTKPSPGP